MATTPSFQCGAPQCRAPGFCSKGDLEEHIIHKHGPWKLTALGGAVEVSRDRNDFKYYCQCNESVWTKAEFHNHVRRNCTEHHSKTTGKTYPPKKGRKPKGRMGEGGHQVSAASTSCSLRGLADLHSADTMMAENWSSGDGPGIPNDDIEMAEHQPSNGSLMPDCQRPPPPNPTAGPARPSSADIIMAENRHLSNSPVCAVFDHEIVTQTQPLSDPLLQDCQQSLSLHQNSGVFQVEFDSELPTDTSDLAVVHAEVIPVQAPSLMDISATQHRQPLDSVERSPPRDTFIPISLHDSRFRSLEMLDKVNLIIFEPLKILICMVCHVAVPPKSLRKHWRQSHSDGPRLTEDEIQKFSAEHHIFGDNLLQEAPVFEEPIPGVAFFEVLVCPEMVGCYQTTSDDLLGRHRRSKHPRQNPDITNTGFVHKLFNTNDKLYRIRRVPQLKVIVGDLDQNAAVDFLLCQQDKRLEAIKRGPLNSLSTDPFIQKFLWHEYIHGISPEVIARLISPPVSGDPLHIIPLVTKKYLEGIITMIKMTRHKNTTGLRWVNTTKGNILNRPLKVPFKQDTIDRYLQCMGLLIVFSLRVTDPVAAATFRLNPSSSVLSKCNALRTKVQSRTVATNDGEIQHAIHELILALLSPRQLENSDCIGSTFIIFNTYPSSNRPLSYESINTMLTSLKWPFRASSFSEIRNKIQEKARITGGELTNGELEDIIKEVHTGVREDGFGLFTYMMEVTHYLSVLRKNSTLLPRVHWKNEDELQFDSRTISMTDFSALYQKLLSETKTLLQEEVLLGLQIPPLDLDQISDNLSCRELGYSFVNDPANSLFEWSRNRALLKHMLSNTHHDRFWFKERYKDGESPTWNRTGVNVWIRSCENCLANMFALLHYGAGQPARGPELSSLKWVNAKDQARSVFCFLGYVNIITTYNKTQTNSERPRLICRSLPPAVGQIFVIWMTFVVPVLDCIWADMEPNLPPEEQSIFAQHVFASRQGVLDTDDFSAILSSLSGPSTLEGGLGFAMTISTTRQFLITVMRRYIQHVPDTTRTLLEEYFDEQSGHGEDAAVHYGLPSSSISNVSAEHLARFVELSKLHHLRLGQNSQLVGRTSAPRPPNAEDMSIRSLDYDILAEKMLKTVVKSSSFSAQVAAQLGPKIHEKMAESVSVLVPNLRPQRQVQASVPRSVSLLSGPFIPDSIDEVDDSKVVVSQKRWDELRQMMGHEAVFKSTSQACAVELCARRQNDLLVILGTGQGKSLLFTLNAFRPEERGMATIVVVPLLSLQRDLERRMKERGVKVLLWNSQNIHTEVDASIQVVLIVSDSAAQPAFETWLLNQSDKGRIARLVFDEAHCVVMDSHYRPRLAGLNSLRQAKVQIVALTATAPKSIIPEIMKCLGLLPSTTLVIRGSTMRKEISYSVFRHHRGIGFSAQYRDVSGETTDLKGYIDGMMKILERDSKILIFCFSTQETEQIASKLKVPFYHAQLDPETREGTYNMFAEGKIRLLVTTNALGLGVSFDDISVVIHWGAPQNLVDFSQHSGRVGRNGQKSFSAIFFRSTAPFPSDPRQTTAGIQEMNDFMMQTNLEDCRRVVLGKADGVVDPPPCTLLLPIALCDLCAYKVGQVPRWILPNRRSEGSIQHKRPIDRRMEPHIGYEDDSRDLSPFPEPAHRSHTVEPSQAIQIAAAVAHNRVNSKGIDAQWLRQRLKRLQQICSIKCAFCCIRQRESDHTVEQCETFKSGKEIEKPHPGCLYPWKFIRSIQLPSGICFHCAVPQSKGLHENNNYGLACQRSRVGWVRPMLFRILNSSTFADVREEFQLPRVLSEARIALANKDEGVDSCLLHVILVAAALKVALI